MGIKTNVTVATNSVGLALKNLPTTWGLRPITSGLSADNPNSEKPPHHMGIKT